MALVSYLICNLLDYGTSQYSDLYTTSFKLRMYFAVSCKALLLVTDTLICAAVPKGVYIYDSKSLTKKLLKSVFYINMCFFKK